MASAPPLFSGSFSTRHNRFRLPVRSELRPAPAPTPSPPPPHHRDPLPTIAIPSSLLRPPPRAFRRPFFSQVSRVQAIEPLASHLKILTFTWNVGNVLPFPHELHHWCPEGGGGCDIVVVGTQENYFLEASLAIETAVQPCPRAGD